MTSGIREELVAVGAAIAISAVVVGYALRPAPRREAADLEVQVLPGMVLRMPPGAVLTGGYPAGSAQVERGDATVSVRWMSADRLDPDQVKMIADDNRRGVAREWGEPVTESPVRDVTVGGAPAHEVTLTGPRGAATITAGLCDGRMVVITTRAPAATGTELHRAARDSFSCRPELTHVAMAPELAVDRRDGWYAVPVAGTRAWTTSTGSTVMARVVPLKEGAAAEQAFIEKAIKNSGAAMSLGPRSDRPTASGTRPVWIATGDARDIALSVWSCAGGHRVLGVASTRHGDSLEPAIDLLLTARCLKPGEASPEYPSPPTSQPR